MSQQHEKSIIIYHAPESRVFRILNSQVTLPELAEDMTVASFAVSSLQQKLAIVTTKSRCFVFDMTKNSWREEEMFQRDVLFDGENLLVFPPSPLLEFLMRKNVINIRNRQIFSVSRAPPTKDIPPPFDLVVSLRVNGTCYFGL